jgi:hypothetical protein
MALGMVFVVSGAMVLGQSPDAEPVVAGSSMTVEASYRQESVELMIIRELSREENRDMKMKALENIGTFIEKGDTEKARRTEAALRADLKYMAFEGIINKTRKNGKVVNNYPDVRATVAGYLGELGGPESEEILIKMIKADYEPLVLIEVIKSLTKIGITEETLTSITKVISRFDLLDPNSLLALAALEAYEKFAGPQHGTLDPATIQLIRRISEGSYRRPVRERAKQILLNLSRF